MTPSSSGLRDGVAAERAGAVAVGARPFLIAWNINLDTGDVEVAKRIARRVRESGGGLPAVQGNGFRIEELDAAQVFLLHGTVAATTAKQLNDTFGHRFGDLAGRVEFLHPDVVEVARAMHRRPRVGLRLLGVHGPDPAPDCTDDHERDDAPGAGERNRPRGPEHERHDEHDQADRDQQRFLDVLDGRADRHGLIEDRPHRISNGRVVEHDQPVTVPEPQCPGLDVAALQRGRAHAPGQADQPGPVRQWVRRRS